MKIIFTFLFCILVSGVLETFAQAESPTRGFLMTRVSAADRLNLTKFPLTTPKGTQVYDTASKSFWYWDGTKWVEESSVNKADTTNDHWKNDVGQLKLAYNSNGSVRSAGTEFVIKDNGNVGIGNSETDAKFLVYGNSLNDITLRTSDNSSQGLAFQNGGTYYTWNIFRKDAGAGKADLVFAGNGSAPAASISSLNPYVTMKAGGNVGIGDTNPSEKLSVLNGNISLTNSIPNLVVNTSDDSKYAQLLFRQNGTNLGGFQMIGTNFGVASRAGNMEFFSASSGNAITFLTQGANERMRITREGNVGLGTSDPQAKLHTNGTVRHEGLAVSNTNIDILSVDANGNVARRPFTSFLPKLIVGNDGTDAIATQVIVTATTTSPNNDVSQEIYTVTFTLDKESLLDVSSIISFSVYDDNSEPINTSFVKLFGTTMELYQSGTTAPIRKEAATIAYTNIASVHQPGLWHTNSSFKHKLSAGTYVLKIKGNIKVLTSDTEGARALFGKGKDSVDITATPVN